MLTKKMIAATLAAACVTLAACGSDEDDSAATSAVTEAPAASEAPAATDAMTTEPMTTEPMAAGDIVAVASANDDFSTLVAAVSAAGLVETLQGEGPFTVFAPTNEAFAELPDGLLDALLLPENVDVLTQILTYHVVSGAVMAADVTTGDVPTVEGSDLSVVAADGVVTINGAATVTATDVAASNGVIHVIDSVLVPPTVDVEALLAGDTMSTEPMTTDAGDASAAGDIVAVASANEDFSTLVAAVAAAGLVETLQSEGPFTVFAPTNDAFAALPAGLVDKLLLPENVDVLTQILTYHVVAGEVLAADVATGDVPTVEGSDLAIVADAAGVTINGSTTVIATDVMASNGVIHVIDSVLLPPGLDVSAL